MMKKPMNKKFVEDTTMKKKFENICRMDQKSLKTYVFNELLNTHKEIYSRDGFVFAVGNFPVLLVAHLDTVHKNPPIPMVYDPETSIYSSPNGIGGDDRCGVYMILKIVQKFNCSVLFCEDEEIGGVGAEKFVKSEFLDAITPYYIIEFDRRGNNDAVFYNCNNPEFEEFITESFFETKYGTFSDISVIAPAMKKAAVNLSCGYYGEHSLTEIVVFNDMEKVIKETMKILDKTTVNDSFEYIPGKDYEIFDAQDWYSNFETLVYYVSENGYEEVQIVLAASEEEAVGKFLIEHENLCFNDIIDVVS